MKHQKPQPKTKRPSILRDVSLMWVVLVLPLSLFIGDADAHSVRSSSPPPLLPLQPSRRDIINQLALLGGGSAGMMTLFPRPCEAGEVGAKINQAVTQSELGISIRRSVVRGAQTMDALDGRWEQFSDKFGLGSARSEQPGKPKPKVIPDPRPLDTAVAQKIVDIADGAFVWLCDGVSASSLRQQIEKVAQQVQPSFERSGLSKEDIESSNARISSNTQFNFVSYVHFKAYSDIIVEQQKTNFPALKRAFERQVGMEVLKLLIPDWEERKLPNKCDALKSALDDIDRLSCALVEKGLVASVDPSPLDAEQVASWCVSGDDLTWSIALDGDITLGSQLLLQEQGFRFYPNYGRFAIQRILETTGSPDITVEDYYMDTDYNSDPSRFQVKEVLLNIELKSDY